MQIVAITSEAMPFGGDTVEYVLIPEGMVKWMSTLYQQYQSWRQSYPNETETFGGWLKIYHRARDLKPDQIRVFDTDFGDWESK